MFNLNNKGQSLVMFVLSIETKLPESLFSDERGLYLKLYYFHRSIGYILIDPVDNLRLHDLHRIPSEEVIRDEKRFYQQHDARVEDTGIHDLARRPDVEGFGYNEESGRIQAYIRRNQRRDEAIELLGRESATDVFVRTTESSA